MSAIGCLVAFVLGVLCIQDATQYAATYPVALSVTEMATGGLLVVAALVVSYLLRRSKP